MPCQTIRFPNGSVAIVCSLGRKPANKKKWSAEIFQVSGQLLRRIMVTAENQEAAMAEAICQAGKLAGGFMVRIGKMERLVLQEEKR